jgi:hypothetical protein
VQVEGSSCSSALTLSEFEANAFAGACLTRSRGSRFVARLLKTCFLSWLFVLLGAVSVRAGIEQSMMATAPPAPSNRFAFGAKEVENMMGAFFFFDTTQNQRPSIDFALDSLRLGIMLNDPWDIGPLSGNFEALGEVFVGGVFTGPGNVLAGATLVFRYNFVQPKARVVPYMQIGAGGVYTDIPEDESRGLISLPVEFNLQAGVGTRFLVNDHWSVNLEGVYRHISNAEIHKPNFGIDSVGGNLGFGFSF